MSELLDRSEAFQAGDAKKPDNKEKDKDLCENANLLKKRIFLIRN